jgi:hypothetical protein
VAIKFLANSFRKRETYSFNLMLDASVVNKISMVSILNNYMEGKKQINCTKELNTLPDFKESKTRFENWMKVI